MFALVVGRLVGETSAENMVHECDEYKIIAAGIILWILYIFSTPQIV